MKLGSSVTEEGTGCDTTHWDGATEVAGNKGDTLFYAYATHFEYDGVDLDRVILSGFYFEYYTEWTPVWWDDGAVDMITTAGKVTTAYQLQWGYEGYEYDHYYYMR